jgi:hypothetical protein
VHGTGNAKKPEVEKKASFYALPSQHRYPLDNYQQVKEASQYFELFSKRMPPEDRHEYCVNLVKRANDLSMQLPAVVRKYGSEKYASAYEIDMALDTRRRLLLDPTDRKLLDKIASVLPTLAPGEFCDLLSGFDQLVGLSYHYDKDVMDPFYSTYGFSKTAEEDPEDFSDTIGNYHVTQSQLKTLGQGNFSWLKKTFGLDFAQEFVKDPVGIYKSLPVDQKKLVIRMATENSPK